MDNRIASWGGCLAVTLLTASLLAGCASTRLTALYRDPGYSDGPLGSILVVGIFDAPERRRLFEEAFVRELRRRHVTAWESLEALGADAPVEREQVEPALGRLGIAGVLVVRLVGLREEEAYTPPVYFRRETMTGTNVYVYSAAATGLVVKEGYTTTYAHYTLESRLFRAGTGSLLWSARSETVAPESAAQIATGLSRVVLDGLARDGLLP
jgi:hypothetical protein